MSEAKSRKRIAKSTPSLAESIKEVLEKTDPNKVSALIVACVSPFREQTRQARKEVLWFTGAILAIGLIGMFTLAVMRLTDAIPLMFLVGTMIGYIFGFLSRFLIRD